jgi:phage-related baseplate assembly protein
MTTRFVSNALDLSRLPAPEVVKAVDYEAILAARLADLKVRLAAAGLDFDTGNLESEPAAILEQADAYREALTLAAINDAARAVMLATATGANLDNLAAFYGVQRLVIVPADPTANPPVVEVLESDADLRRRVQLAPEQLPYAGMTGGGYRALALRLAPSVKDVTTVKRDGGRVDVVLLGRDGDGTVPDEVVSTVYAGFQDDAATQLTDIVTVRGATIVPYSAALTLKLRAGPDPVVIKAAAEAAVRAYCADRHRVGAVVYANMIEAAAAVGGVENATVDIDDIDPGADGAAFLSALTVTYAVV